MSRNRTGVYLYYDFDWKGKQESFTYEIPKLDIVADGIRALFNWRDVSVDATDVDLINFCEEFGIDYEDDDQFIKYCKDICKEDAYEEFVEEMLYYEEEESTDESLKEAEDKVSTEVIIKNGKKPWDGLSGIVLEEGTDYAIVEVNFPVENEFKKVVQEFSPSELERK